MKSEVRSLMSFLPQLMGDQLADEVAVGLARGERAVPAVVVEELAGVRQVEVPGEEKRVLKLARLVHEWMTERHLVLSEGGVAKVAEEDAFDFGLLAFDFRSLRSEVRSPIPVSPCYRPQHVHEGSRRGGLGDPVRCLAGDGTGAKDRRARPVLAPVVLFLKKQRELRPAEVASGGWRSAQDHHRHSAFMLQFVGHSLFPVSSSLNTRTACRGTSAAASARRRPSSPARPRSFGGKASRRGPPCRPFRQARPQVR